MFCLWSLWGGESFAKKKDRSAKADAEANEEAAEADESDAEAQQAAPSVTASAPQVQEMLDLDMLIGFRGVSEVWQDPFVAVHYRGTSFGGTGFMAVSLPWVDWVMGELELGYVKLTSDESISYVADGTMELMPVTLLAEARGRMANGELFAGVGPALTVFTERTVVGTVAGAKMGFEIRGGVRIHTNMVQQTMLPSASGGISKMDVELFFGRRQHQAFGTGSGFDLSAFRVGIGLVGRL